jgi:hypothetical protein
VIVWLAERTRLAIDFLACRGIEPRWLDRIDLALVRWLCDSPVKA